MGDADAAPPLVVPLAEVEADDAEVAAEEVDEAGADAEEEDDAAEEDEAGEEDAEAGEEGAEAEAEELLSVLESPKTPPETWSGVVLPEADWAALA